MIFLARHPTLYRLWSSMKVYMINIINIRDHTEICYSNNRGSIIYRVFCQFLSVMSVEITILERGKVQFILGYSKFTRERPKICPGSINFFRFPKIEKEVGGSRMMIAYFLYGLLENCFVPTRTGSNECLAVIYINTGINTMIDIQKSFFFRRSLD